MATAASRLTGDESFFRKMAIGLSLFIILGFIQFSLRGFVDIPAAPVWVHLHGVVFVSWLALIVTQSTLAERGSLQLHRRLGWAGAGLAALMVVLGAYTGIKAIELHRVPPFFTNAHFLVLTNFGMLVFGGVVAWAIVMRRRTDWHRRLMLTATVLLLEPALGRVLPMPLLGDWGQAVELVLQLGVFAIAFAHDRRTRGAVHPALLWGAGVLVFFHASVWLLGRSVPVVALAERLALG